MHSTVVVGGASPSALPYDIYYSKLPENKTLTVPGSATYSLAGFYVHIDRHITPFWINIYIPVTLLVTISWLRYYKQIVHTQVAVEYVDLYLLL